MIGTCTARFFVKVLSPWSGRAMLAPTIEMRSNSVGATIGRPLVRLLVLHNQRRIYRERHRHMAVPCVFVWARRSIPLGRNAVDVMPIVARFGGLGGAVIIDGSIGGRSTTQRCPFACRAVVIHGSQQGITGDCVFCYARHACGNLNPIQIIFTITRECSFSDHCHALGNRDALDISITVTVERARVDLIHDSGNHQIHILDQICSVA